MEGAVTESEDRLCTTEEVAVKTFLSLPAADGEVSLQDQSILKQECQTRTNRPAWALPAQSHSARVVVVVGVFVGWGGRGEEWRSQGLSLSSLSVRSSLTFERLITGFIGELS